MGSKRGSGDEGALGRSEPPRASLRGSRTEEMVRSATSCDDHRKVALYYRRGSREAREMAAAHRELADAYRSQPAGLQPGARNSATEHCLDLAAISDEFAARYETLAIYHERLAGE